MSEDNVLGTLDKEEKLILDGLRASVRDLTFEIGQLELRKVQVIRRIGENEIKAQQILQGVGKRLEIPENMVWQVVDDKVMKAPQQMQSSEEEEN